MSGRLVDTPVLTLVRAADFQRVLGTPIRARSGHFAVHHVAARPVAPRAAQHQAVVPELSTVDAPNGANAVDNTDSTMPAVPEQHWLGLVVPKRHAKRAATRNLVKRQMRALFADHAASLPRGLWVLRLRHPFDKQQFPSAASDALRRTVRDELSAALQRAGVR